MRTLQIGLNWFFENAGGSHRYFYDVVRLAPSVGVEAIGLVAGRKTVEEESGGRVRAFAPMQANVVSRMLSSRSAIKEVLATYRPDLVVSHFAMHTFAALDAIDVPLIVNFQGPWYQESRQQGSGLFNIKAKHFLEKRVYERADRLIVLSRSFRDLLCKDYDIAADRVTVCPGFVDCASFDIAQPCGECREALGWPTDRPIILAVRRLVKRMGLENLLDAIAIVKSHYPDILLLIGGRGPEQEALRLKIVELGLEHNVRLLGFISNENLPLAYRAADLSVVPTLTLEGFGLITVESLAAGTPVMVTPSSALPEVVGPLSADLVFPGLCASGMADRLLSWLDGSTKLPTANECRDYAFANYDSSVVMKRISGIYREVLKGHG